MKNYYWETDSSHSNNSITMYDFIENHNTELEITFVDGSYAEGVNSEGQKYKIHAGGDGDFKHHCIRFVELNE